MHVDLRAPGRGHCGRRRLVVARAGADRPAPERCREQGRPLRERRDQVAVARGLAAEGEDPPGRSTRWNSAEGALQVGDVVQHGVPEDQVEAPSSKGSFSASAATVFTFRPSSRRVLVQRRQHPRRDVGGGRPLDDAGLHQVEREVAGPGADLERVAERPAGRAPSALPNLPVTCS